MANVIFKFGTRAQYDALITKDEHTLYWLSDTQELMKGDICYGKGSNATQQAAGLLSLEDKKKLDELSASGVFNLAPVDASVIITDVADGGKTIGVQLSKVEGNILTIKDDGLFAKVETVPLESVTGLKERLEAIEQSAVSGVHYKGSVATFDELPADAEQGDLWEVAADNSEWCWNGEKWFEYGSASGLKPIARADYNTDQFEIDENNTLNIVKVDANIVGYRNQALDETLPELFVNRKYEITDSLFEDTLVNYRNGEIRVMFAKNSPFAKQVGTGGDPNCYYMGFRAYAPDDATNFKEDMAEIISDNTLYSFTGNDFAGIDEYGRKYSIVWLPVAVYDAASDTWTYHGDKSSAKKYIGWYYSVEWYDANGTKIGADTIRINLSNEDCHTSAVPYFMNEYAKVEDVQAVENAMKWQDI